MPQEEKRRVNNEGDLLNDKEIVAPERTKFQTLMTEIFEETEPIVEGERLDVQATNAELALTSADVWQQFKEDHQKVKHLGEHLRNLDTALRGRDLGSLKRRAERQSVYSLIEVTAAGLDIADVLLLPGLTKKFAEKFGTPNPTKRNPNPGPRGVGALKIGLEQISNKLINEGIDWAVQKTTGLPKARFASPVSRTLSTMINFIPVIGQPINAPVIEAEFRKLYNLPIVGVPVEKLYNAANRWLRESNSRWVTNLMASMVKAEISPQPRRG